MALQLISAGDVVALGFDPATGERGFLTKIVNGTGAASVKGALVSASTTADNQYIHQANEFDTIGVVAEAGVANGSATWIWKNGSRCQVLLKDGESATRGYLMLAADTDGRARNVAVPNSNPVVGEHFKEVGHVCESKSSGTNVLALTDIHFN
jgi:Iap family predicted aminopeptidase